MNRDNLYPHQRELLDRLIASGMVQPATALLDTPRPPGGVSAPVTALVTGSVTLGTA